MPGAGGFSFGQGPMPSAGGFEAKPDDEDDDDGPKITEVDDDLD